MFLNYDHNSEGSLLSNNLFSNSHFLKWFYHLINNMYIVFYICNLKYGEPTISLCSSQVTSKAKRVLYLYVTYLISYMYLNLYQSKCTKNCEATVFDENTAVSKCFAS